VETGIKDIELSGWGYRNAYNDGARILLASAAGRAA
jgi:hypothetical protein